jgi:hypothetical protein
LKLFNVKPKIVEAEKTKKKNNFSYSVRQEKGFKRMESMHSREYED